MKCNLKSEFSGWVALVALWVGTEACQRCQYLICNARSFWKEHLNEWPMSTSNSISLALRSMVKGPPSQEELNVIGDRIPWVQATTWQLCTECYGGCVALEKQGSTGQVVALEWPTVSGLNSRRGVDREWRSLTKEPKHSLGTLGFGWEPSPIGSHSEGTEQGPPALCSVAGGTWTAAAQGPFWTSSVLPSDSGARSQDESEIL